MILDTNFLIDILEGRDSASEKLEELEENGVPLVLAPRVLFELFVGAEKPKDVEKLAKNLQRAEYTRSSEREAARIKHELIDEGKPISSIDYLIAGTDRKLEETVLSSDSHFEQVRNLEVENYR